jgi:hypothetical protein
VSTDGPEPPAGPNWSGPYGLPPRTDPAELAAEHQDSRDVTPGDSRRATGAHRAPASRSTRTLTYVLLGVGGALVLLALGLGVKGWLGSSGGSTGAGPTNSQVHVPSLTGSPTPTRPSQSFSPSPSATPKPTPTHTATPSPKPTPKPSPTRSSVPPPAPPPVVRAPVVVLNETGITGLAARTAAQLRALGWTVTGIGNWRGSIPTTTVYYPAGRYAAARRLAYDLHVSRLRPVVPGMLGDRLTVVLADP